MSDFVKFADAVHARYEELAKGELYTVAVDDLYESYLAAFPEGTNPIRTERREYECNTCSQFIKRLGNVVSITPDGDVLSVWDNYENLPHYYPVVSKTLSDLVSKSTITGIFRSKERQYGCSHTTSLTTRIRWNHFHGKVADRHFSEMPDKLIGEKNGIVQVFRRGLEQFNFRKTDFIDIIDLIENNGIYRGSEHLAAIKGFKDLLHKYNVSPNRDAFIWANSDNKFAGFRNTAIGSLFVDLAEGVELETAVKKFESKVAPSNYKRPTAVITPRMIDDAMKTIEELGLSDSLNRRFARMDDVSVNDVLYVNGTVKGKMRDGLANVLMEAVKPKPVKITQAQEITGEEFLKTVVPKAKDINVLVENKHLGNFVSLTAAENPDATPLFKWDNDKAWSYSGDVTDSMRAAVTAAGGRVDGVLRFTHQWNHEGRNASLMDLHVFMPGNSDQHKDGCHDIYPWGQRVGWNQRTDAYSRGVQDVDYTDAAPEGYVPVENITFPSMEKLRDGKYVFKIHNWQYRKPTTSGFKAEIEFDGQIFQYDHPAPLKNKQWITLAEVTLTKGVFTIEHKHPTTAATREKWGVKTNQLLPVDTLMLSPNYWDGKAVGNKHYIFVLKGAKNPEPVRGIYNEFLRPDLEKHRKVFEVLGAKTKAQPSDDQLSGLGFSSTRKDEVNVVVDGRAYTVKF